MHWRKVAVGLLILDETAVLMCSKESDELFSKKVVSRRFPKRVGGCVLQKYFYCIFKLVFIPSCVLRRRIDKFLIYYGQIKKNFFGVNAKIGLPGLSSSSTEELHLLKSAVQFLRPAVLSKSI